MKLLTDNFDNHAFHFVETDDGYIRAKAYVGRTGIQSYFNSDGSERKELRLAEDVLSHDIQLQLENIPVTLGHPKDSSGYIMLNPNNASKYSVGATKGEARIVDDQYLGIDVLLTDQKAIEAARSGTMQISLGYYRDLEEKSGDFAGQKYDGIQRNLKLNHLAIVDTGRAGPKVRLGTIDQNISCGEKMKRKILLNQKEFELDEELAVAFESEIHNLKSTISELKTRNDALADEKTTSEAKADALEAELSNVKNQTIDHAIVARMAKELKDLYDVAEKCLDEKSLTNIESMSALEIKKSILQPTSKVNLDEKEESYINARYDYFLELQSKSATDSLGSSIQDSRSTVELTDPLLARSQYMEKSRNQWKNSLN